jgi:hypothetical protein
MALSDQETQVVEAWRDQAQALVQAWHGLLAVDKGARNLIHREAGVSLLSPPATIHEMAGLMEYFTKAVAHLDRLKIL